MPILIRELEIKVSVNAPEGSPAAGMAGPPARSASGGSTSSNPDERNQLVAECVEQVLAILRSQQEA